MTHWTDLSFPPEPRFVGVARAAALAAAETTTLSAERIADLRTCVSEAVSNAVTAHLRAQVREDVRVRFGCDTGAVIVEVHDAGPGVPQAVLTPVPALDSDEDVMLTEGGYGLPVMRALADEVELVPHGDSAGTLVRLRFG